MVTLFVPGGGGGALLSNGLLGMCRWMGSHFHDSTDYIMGSPFQAFSIELLEWGRTFRDFESKKIICPKVTKMGFIIGHKIDQK